MRIFKVVLIVFSVLFWTTIAHAQIKFDPNPNPPAKDSINWIKGKPTANEIEAQKAMVAQFNLLYRALFYYERCTGKKPLSLKQVYEEGYLFYIPFNYIRGDFVKMDGPNHPEPIPGDIWISWEGGKGKINMLMSIWAEHRLLSLSLMPVKPDWRKNLYFDTEPYVKDYYSDPVNLKLYSMMEQLRDAVAMHGKAEPSALLAWPAWPLTSEGKNPVTGEPLKMEKSPGNYFIGATDKNADRLLVFAVYGKANNPICNPWVRMKNSKQGVTWFDEWVGIVYLKGNEENLQKSKEYADAMMENLKPRGR